MRAFAEFVMRGRTQAVMVAVLGVGTLLFAWVSAAVIALVTLRKGVSNGAHVWLWALLPAGIIAYMGRDVGPLASITGALVASAVLRLSAAWSAALVAAAVSGFVTGLLMLTVGAEQLQAIMALLQQFMDNVQQQSVEPVELTAPGEKDVAGLIGLSNAGSVVMSLIIARWLQAMLYNPGGFRQEMLALRLPPVLSLVLLAGMIGLPMMAADWQVWSVILSVPLMVAGVCLVHGLVDRAGLSSSWLWAFYTAWLLIGQLRFVVALAAVVDSVVDFRGRVAVPPPPDDEDR